jgi:hypothetical protein
VFAATVDDLMDGRQSKLGEEVTAFAKDKDVAQLIANGQKKDSLIR